MTSTIRTRRHRATRREILDAAWAQAAEVGIAAISLRDLARAVGMKAPSLYTYFANKDAIYDAMFAEGYVALDAHFDGFEEAVAGGDHVDAVARGLARFIEFCQASPARYQLMFTRAVPGWEPSPEAYARSVASYERSTVHLARFGFETDAARDLYLAVAAGLAAQQMANEPEGDRWKRLAPAAAQMMVGHLDGTEGLRRGREKGTT